MTHIPPPYPAQPQPWTPPPARPPTFWSTTKGQWTIAGIVVGSILLAFAAVWIWIDVQARHARDLDVDVTACEFSAGSLPMGTIELTVHNKSDEERLATITVEYRDSSGNRVDTDTARVTVPAGDTVKTRESTILDAPVTGAAECGVTSVR